MRNNITKINNSGFAIIPILIGIGLLLVGGGAGVVMTKKFVSPTSESTLASAINNIPEATPIEASNNLEAEEENNENQPKQEDEGNIIAELPPPKNILAPTVPKDNQYQTPAEAPTTVANANINTPTTISPITQAQNTQSQTDTAKDELLRMSHDKTKVESRNLTEGIEFVENRYKELLSFRDRGLELCKSRYEMNVSSAKSQADSLKRSYLESRTGFASQPSIISDIDRALEIDLARISNEYELCKSKHTVNTTVERDLGSIKTEQTNVMRKLTRENAVSSLENILALQKKLIATADKL